MELITTEKDKAEEYKRLQEQNKDKIHISFSEFSKFQSCGHRHLLEKYLKLTEEPPSIHLIFGNSVHKAIELGIKNKSDIEKRVAIFREDFTKEMMDNMRDSPDYKHMNQFLGEGENIIRYLSTEKILKKYDIIGIEYALYEPLYGVFYFKGFIDLIVQDKKTKRFVIIDWKTSGEAWDVSKKKKDNIFMAQMRFYKFFFARKHQVPLDQIDCTYVVLNRLKNKKFPEFGFGELQTVPIYATEKDIEESILLVADTIKSIHIDNVFPKAKLNGQKGNCFFCPHKNNIGNCNGDDKQYVQLLKIHQDKIS